MITWRKFKSAAKLAAFLFMASGLLFVCGWAQLKAWQYVVISTAASFIITVLAWTSFGPALEEALRSLGEGDLTSFLVRASVAVTAFSVCFFNLMPRKTEWFAYLGSYFAPILGLLSLTILAAALGLQRKDLESTRASLNLVQEQLLATETARLYSDTPTVLVKKIGWEDERLRATIQSGGGGPALNVVLEIIISTVTGSDGRIPKKKTDQVLFRRRFGILIRGVELTEFFRKVETAKDSDKDLRNSDSSDMRLRVVWQNIHRTQFKYLADLPTDESGSITEPERIRFYEPILAVASN